MQHRIESSGLESVAGKAGWPFQSGPFQIRPLRTAHTAAWGRPLTPILRMVFCTGQEPYSIAMMLHETLGDIFVLLLIVMPQSPTLGTAFASQSLFVRVRVDGALDSAISISSNNGTRQRRMRGLSSCPAAKLRPS